MSPARRPIPLVDADTPHRPARDDESCSCKRPAAVVFLTEQFGEVPWCGDTLEQIITAAALRHPSGGRS